MIYPLKFEVWRYIGSNGVAWLTDLLKKVQKTNKMSNNQTNGKKVS